MDRPSRSADRASNRGEPEISCPHGVAVGIIVGAGELSPPRRGRAVRRELATYDCTFFLVIDVMCVGMCALSSGLSLILFNRVLLILWNTLKNLQPRLRHRVNFIWTSLSAAFGWLGVSIIWTVSIVYLVLAFQRNDGEWISRRNARGYHGILLRTRVETRLAKLHQCEYNIVTQRRRRKFFKGNSLI